MLTFLTTIHVLVAVILILIVLVQSARGTDVAASFGGMGGSQAAFGPRGTATVLSKAYYSPDCFDSPRAFAETNLNRLWNICENRFANFEFFATSVVGSLGYGSDEFNNVVPYPLHVAPRGILEPFEWILSKL